MESVISQNKDIVFFHPITDGDLFVLRSGRYTRVEKLLNQVMKDGRICMERPSLKELQDYAAESQSHFHKSYKRLINPHIYKVSLSRKLKDLKHNLRLESKGIKG